MTPRSAALVFLLAFASQAHQPDPASLRHDMWQTDNGLPHDVVRSLAQTPDGYLWIGMTNALARFDGVRIVRVAPQQLTGTQLLSLVVDSRGRLVAGTLAGVYVLDGERLLPLEGAEEVTSVHAVAADAHDTFWIGTERGLYRRGARPGGLLRLLPDQIVNAVSIDPQGAVWAGTRKGLFRISGDGAVTRQWLQGESVTAVLTEGDEVLAGTDGNGLYSVIPNGEPRRVHRQELGDHVVSLRRDRTGDLWVGTWERGLFRVSGERVTEPVDVLTGEVQVVALFEDREGNVWAGTRGSGMHRIRRQLIRNLSTSAGMPHPLAWAAAESPDGTVWIGTDGGLAVVKDGQVLRRYSEADGLPGRVITTVAAGADGSVYAGTPGSGVARIRNGRVERLHIPEAVGTTLNHICVARNGHLWLSTMRGVLELNGATVVRRISRADGLPANGVRSVSEAADGSFWAATSKGAVRITASGIEVFGASRGLEISNIRSVTHDSAGNVWVATQGGGLCRLAGNRFRCLSRDRGLPDIDIHAAIPDQRGYLWLTTAVGLHRLAVAEWTRAERGESPSVPLYSLGLSDGMGTDTCTGGIQPGALLASNGLLWVPTLKGIATLDVRQTLAPVRLNPLVEHLTTSGEWGRDLQVDFTAPLLSGGRRVRFRYRLEPFDRDWVTVDNRRTAFYTNLPPGAYQFRLAVRNQDGDWVESSHPARFEVRPRMHETLWFRIAAILALAGLVCLFVHWRLRTAARRREELTRMVEERTQELQLAHARLAKADRAKSNFLSFISHEIRTPLNGILATTSLWHTFRNEDEHRQALETIDSCGEALLGIVNNVLDLTRIEAGRLDLEESVFSPRVLAERAVAVIGMQAAKNRVAVCCDIADSMPEAVRADGSRLRQVLLNLLGNAAKFTPAGSIELSASAEPAGDGWWRLCFAVRDTGIGIAPEVLPTLFEPFSQASGGANRYGGSGLGLSISRQIVAAMHGGIRVTSELGKGSTFEFSVLAAEAVPVPVPQITSDSFEGESPEVLVVEDNRVNQMVAVRMLTTLGCRVEVAESGAAALGLLTQPGHDFRVVFMDCMMPELDGYETTRRIRQMPGVSQVPVVAVSADAFGWSRDRALEAGMNSYLTKPLRIEDLRRELSAWVRTPESRN